MAEDDDDMPWPPLIGWTLLDENGRQIGGGFYARGQFDDNEETMLPGQLRRLIIESGQQVPYGRYNVELTKVSKGSWAENIGGEMQVVSYHATAKVLSFMTMPTRAHP